MAHINFVNDAGRTYLEVNGNRYGYYRKNLDGKFKCVLKAPFYSDAVCDSEEEAQSWLKRISKVG